MNKIEFNKMEISKQIEYVNNKLKEGAILSVVCEEIGISRSTVSARFNREGFKYNKYFRQYISLEDFGAGHNKSNKELIEEAVAKTSKNLEEHFGTDTYGNEISWGVTEYGDDFYDSSVSVRYKFENIIREILGSSDKVELGTNDKDIVIIKKHNFGGFEVVYKNSMGSWCKFKQFNGSILRTAYDTIYRAYNEMKSKEAATEEVIAPKTNKELIEEAVAKEGLVICSCTKDIEKLPKKDLDRVIGVIGYGSSSTVYMNFDDTDYIVEVSQVDDEVAIWLITRADYEDIYGEIYEEDWEWELI